MSEAQTRDYRYERKFLVEQLDASQVRMLVRRHPSLFSESYPPRVVNNLYLDTEELDNYYANVCGAAERQKVVAVHGFRGRAASRRASCCERSCEEVAEQSQFVGIWPMLRDDRVWAKRS